MSKKKPATHECGLAEVQTEHGLMTYLRRLPAAVPTDRVLVHNFVLRPVRRLGVRGFRAWLSPASADQTWLEACDCEWALGPSLQAARMG
jgi:hypothetical protein